MDFENMSLDRIAKMSDDEKMELFNWLQKKIDDGSETGASIKEKYFVTMGGLSVYLYKTNLYSKKDGYFRKQPKRKVNRKAKNDSANAGFSKSEIDAIRRLLAEKDKTDFHGEDLKKIKSDDMKKACFNIANDLFDEWKEFCQTQGCFNISEYASLAMVEYMRNHK